MENLRPDARNIGSEDHEEQRTKAEEIEQEKLLKKLESNYRKHHFSHTHPNHAKHKYFGLDHEPGAF